MSSEGCVCRSFNRNLFSFSLEFCNYLFRCIGLHFCWTLLYSRICCLFDSWHHYSFFVSFFVFFKGDNPSPFRRLPQHNFPTHITPPLALCQTKLSFVNICIYVYECRNTDLCRRKTFYSWEKLQKRLKFKTYLLDQAGRYTKSNPWSLQWEKNSAHEEFVNQIFTVGARN